MFLHSIYNEEKLYTYIERYATAHDLKQTVVVLPYAKEKHQGQMRKGKEPIPYISHPLLVAYHAIMLGLDSDEFISTALLHDVCEDCGVGFEELPVNEETRFAVRLLTKEDSPESKTKETKKKYYSDISENVIAVMIKLLDRCNNVSTMADGFSREKMMRYIEETEEWFYPMIEKAQIKFPMYEKQIVILQYHIVSVVEALKQVLNDTRNNN